MKFRLLTRNFWSDWDTYIGRKKGYVAEIRTAFRPNNIEYGIYQYFIKLPDGSMKTSIIDNQDFKSFNDCSDYVIEWINQQLKRNII